MTKKVRGVSKGVRKPRKPTFKNVIHNWIFCPIELLEGRIQAGRELASTDDDHATLAKMGRRLEQLKREKAEKEIGRG